MLLSLLRYNEMMKVYCNLQQKNKNAFFLFLTSLSGHRVSYVILAVRTFSFDGNLHIFHFNRFVM